MATDTWLDGTNNWHTPSDWSAGVPGASSDVVLNGDGYPKITASFGTIASITATFAGGPIFMDSGASSVTGGVTLEESCGLNFDISGDGGSLLTIGGTLTNEPSSHIFIGNSALSAASTIRAASLVNGGLIGLSGSSTASATLQVNSAAGFGDAGVLTGDVGLSGDALVEFAFGQITTIAANSALSLIGSHAFVAKASNTSSNSALKGLDTVAGVFDLSNGAAVTTSGPLANNATIALDGNSSDGGSLLNVDGTLTNTGTIQIGNAELAARSRVEAASVVNDGTINLSGDQAVNLNATLRTPGSFTNDGSVNFANDYDLLVGPISGIGNFSLSTGSKLEFGSSVSSGETVTFGGGVDKLVLDTPSSFYGTIDDFFHAGDAVLARGFDESATTFLYTQTGANSCSWTLTDATHTAVLNFAGEPYAQSDFSIVAAKGTGYSVIKFV